ncbi:hypothetical protein [Leptolyngbya sp. Heron Island J]|uniref:hypothetical protein n=1 Tax=Leptolyngbya sp. Heron Island J TaxID=1385935 RepID=UPI001268AF0F|nr:hypothetical protein [Leptolyngbya sp. Heron Island J]
MNLTHRLGANLAKHLFIICASSAVVQLAALWFPLKIALIAIAGSLFCMFVGLFMLQFRGIMGGHSWAQRLTFEASTVGILQFSAVVSAVIVGGLVTWVAIF